MLVRFQNRVFDNIRATYLPSLYPTKHEVRKRREFVDENNITTRKYYCDARIQG